MKAITAQERKRLANKAGVDEQYLYQCLTGRRNMEAAEAMEVETILGGELMRWDLRLKDWHRIWPDLVNADGAPPIPEEVASA